MFGREKDNDQKEEALKKDGEENMADRKETKKTRNKKKEEKVLKKTKDKFKKRVIFFGIVNLTALVFLFFVLSELPKKASELSTLINSKIKAEASSKVSYSDLQIQSNKEQSEKVLALFPDDSGLVDFVQLVEELKNSGSVVSFSFASREPVRDKTGSLGVPVLISFEGTWNEIDRDLQSLQEANYLFRPITVDASFTTGVQQTNEDDGEVITQDVVQLDYGGFLYVDESFQ